MPLPITSDRSYKPYIPARHDYITVNISSPNTPGLRSLQQREQLMALLKPLQQARLECAQKQGRQVPVLLKVAPDLERPEMEAIAEATLTHGIDGLIVSNTTISRPDTIAKEQPSQRDAAA